MISQFSLSGIVTPYTGNGRKLGYPTANIAIDTGTPEGLFIGRAELDGDSLPALIFIGAPITLNDDEKRAEAHILDFDDKDLYGKHITLLVERKLRNNEQFDDIDNLRAQMARDEHNAREYFKNKG